MRRRRSSVILVLWRQKTILTAVTLVSAATGGSGLAEQDLSLNQPHISRSLQNTHQLKRFKDDKGIYNAYKMLEMNKKFLRKNNDIQPLKSIQAGISKNEKHDNNPAESTAGLLSEIEFKPRFKNTKKMFNIEVRPAGNSVTFRCAAEGNPKPNITWYKNSETPPVRQLGKIQYNKWSIMLEELMKHDAGNYTCVVCNILGCINFTYNLHVQERYPSKPYIVEGYPGNKTVLVDSTVVFECPLVSDLEPYVYWLTVINGTVFDLPPHNEAFLSGFPEITSENPSDKPETLTLYNVTKEREGWYICVALNSLGHDSAKGYLTVLDSVPPTVMKKQRQNSYLSDILTAVLGSMFFLAAIIVIFILKKLKREKIKNQLALETARAVVTYWTKKVTIENQIVLTKAANNAEPLLMPIVKIEKKKLSQVPSNTRNPMMISEYQLPEDINWEVPRETLSLGKTLGEGAFGKVVKADCMGLLKPGVHVKVAIKMLKESHTDAEMVALISEMEMMKIIGKHTNIINLLGCCTQDGPLYIIVEYALYGNLKDFLRSHQKGNRNGRNENKHKKTLTQKDLVSFSSQVATGMEYLASRKCIHCDLAARNVLVSDDFVLKIADFGLAKDVRTSDYYRKKTEGRVPVKWMAPESLYEMVFTTQTDVWSFGILLWEIMTMGCTPYPNVRGQHMYQHLKSGHRMEKPPCCPLQIYILMRECWYFQPNDRPSFTNLLAELDKILAITDHQNHLDPNLPQQGTPLPVTNLEMTVTANSKEKIVHHPSVDEEEDVALKA